MLKFRVATLEGLDAAIAALYKKVGEEYILDVEGAPDTSRLETALQRQKDENSTLKTTVATLKTEITTHEETIEGIRKGALPKADFDALETSYKDRLKKLGEDKDAIIAGLNGNLNGLLVDNVARDMAARVIAKPESMELLLPHVVKRLKVDIVDGVPTTRVLGKNGQPSALTIDDLEREVVESPTFAPIIKGSSASGGNAAGGGGGNPGAKKLSELTEAQRVEYARKDPVAFRKAVEAERKPA